MVEIDIEQVAKQTCVDYYIKHYRFQPPIDIENLHVQIEDFEWNNAAYRIDVFFLHQQPCFIPYYENFYMSHKIWMTKTGKAIKQEPVYTSNAVHPELSHVGKQTPIGLFPGNYFFKKQFDFIDQVLKDQPAFTLNYGPENLITTQVNFKNGIEDLQRLHANIIEMSTGYQIIFEAERFPLEGFAMNDVSFHIDMEGKCSSLTTTLRQMPGLC